MANARTYTQKPTEVRRAWRLVDVKGKVLGQVATEIAHLLMGKHKPTYTPNIEGGDYVVVINAADVAVTGLKKDNKMYYSHSGIPGGFRARPFSEVIEKNPAEVIELAVKGMLPKNKLQAVRMKRLRVFPGSEHTYADKIQSVKE